MDELVGRIVTNVGIERPVAERAVGIILDFLATEGPADKVPGLLAHLPGGAEAVEAARAEPGGGASITVEIWELTHDAFGSFVADVPSPLAIGTLRLQDGRLVKGFLCESVAAQHAEDISQFGGWRKYLEKVARPGSGK